MMAFQTSAKTHRNKAIRYYPLEQFWLMVSIPTYNAAIITAVTFVYILLYHHHHHHHHHHHRRHHHHPLSLLDGRVAHSEKSTGLADQALIQCSAKIFLLIQRVLRITAFYIRIYRAGRRLGSSELPCNLFGIIPVVDSTDDVIHRPFSVVIFLNTF